MLYDPTQHRFFYRARCNCVYLAFLLVQAVVALSLRKHLRRENEVHTSHERLGFFHLGGLLDGPESLIPGWTVSLMCQPHTNERRFHQPTLQRHTHRQEGL